VLHGAAVECSDQWLVEGIWDGPFADAGFHRSEAFFGSGLRIDGASVAAVVSTALVDRLLYFEANGRLTVSNSLLVLLAASGARLDLDYDYGGDCSASLTGIFGQPRSFRVDCLGAPGVRQLCHGNIVVNSGKVTLELRSSARELDSYEDYLGELRAILARVRENYESPKRRVPVAAYATLSSGYDSAATTCLAREIGVTACFTTIPGASTRNGIELEDGGAVAAALGLSAHLLRPPTAAITSDEAYFLAPTVWGVGADLSRYGEANRHDRWNRRRIHGLPRGQDLGRSYEGPLSGRRYTSGRHIRHEPVRDPAEERLHQRGGTVPACPRHSLHRRHWAVCGDGAVASEQRL